MGWIASTMLTYGSWEPSVTLYEVKEPAGYEGEWRTLILRNQSLRREDRGGLCDERGSPGSMDMAPSAEC